MIFSRRRSSKGERSWFSLYLVELRDTGYCYYYFRRNFNREDFLVVKRKNVAKTGQVAHADDFFQEKTKETKVKRRRFGWGSCLLAIFLIITLFVLFGLGLLASTGLVRIPIISPIVYRENPQPLRIVKPVDQSIEEIFPVRLSKIPRQKFQKAS